MKVLLAEFEDHPAIKQLARQDKYSRDFCSVPSVGINTEHLYAVGGVGKAVVGKRLVGFVNFKHLQRKPFSSIYYMGVDPNHRRQGVGGKLVQWVMDTSPHKIIQLTCYNANEAAQKFYHRLGFRVIEDSFDKHGNPYTRLELK